MSFAFKFNYQPHYAEDTKHSFSKHIFNNGYCPSHPDVLIKKGFFKIKRQECWRCLQQYNQQTELFTKKQTQKEVIQKEVIQEEVLQEKVIQKEVIQKEEQRQEEEVINKETEYLNEYIKYKQILFNYHYEIGGPTKYHYKSFRCKICQKGSITREEFKVINLGHQNCAGPRHIKNNLPVCFNCNYDSFNMLRHQRKRHLYRDISGRERYVKENNLVSSDDMLFIHKFIPIVKN
jgi:hypothetical protein